MLRDESEAYARNSRGAGVPVIRVRYGGMIHTVLLNPITHTVNDMSVCQDQVSRARENLVAADASSPPLRRRAGSAPSRLGGN